MDWIAVNIHVKDGDNLAAKFTSYIYYADISEDALEVTSLQFCTNYSIMLSLIESRVGKT